MDRDCVGLKAKTPEGLNLENAALAHVVVLLEKRVTTKKASKSKDKSKKKSNRKK